MFAMTLASEICLISINCFKAVDFSELSDDFKLSIFVLICPKVKSGNKKRMSLIISFNIDVFLVNLNM